MLTDDASRGRLLKESSTRAFSALRARAMESLAKIRAIALAAFCLVAVAFTAAGRLESRAELGPLLAYALSGHLVLRWRHGCGWREHFTMAAPLFDVVLMFLLLWTIRPATDSEIFTAASPVGAFGTHVALL